MPSKATVPIQGGVLVDDIHESPVDQWQNKTRTIVLLSVIGLFVLLGLFLFVYFTWNHTTNYADIQEHFKYGSIGSEPGGSILSTVGGVLPPYWVFKSLPSVCPEKLPGGWASLGLIFEPGHELPIGVTRRHNLGIEEVGLNCAVCHTGTVRETPASKAQIVLGMPAHQLDLQRFFEFVQDCTLDERLTAGAVIGYAKTQGGMNPLEELLYSLMIIDRTKMSTLGLRNRIGPIFTESVPQWGRGRVDTFNPYKSIQFNWNLSALPHAELIGASDFPSLWNQKPREGMHLHWDGNNTSVDERNLSASLGAGVTPVTVDHKSLGRIHDWIWTLPPPRYPFSIDSTRSARGKAIFDSQCSECHAFGGSKTGTVEDIASVNTDPYRLNSYTYVFATAQAQLYPDGPYRFTHFQKTNGYANQPLDGLWGRAPYFHNGSVPTLWDVLQDPKDRPAKFVRGYDVYDQEKAGFVADPARIGAGEIGKSGFLYDTAIPGNGNGGHLWGTKLPDEQKRDLVEYMKTL